MLGKPQGKAYLVTGPKEIKLPLTERDARELRAGQFVLLNGTIVTGRDRIHKFLANEKPAPSDIPFQLEGAVLYHCGPLVQESPEGRKVLSAGPTTSHRMQMYEAFVIENYKLRGIMGKGGMGGEPFLQALKKTGAVYFQTIGGAGTLLARKIKKIKGVWMLEEFGRAEAMWAFEVSHFPAVITIDSLGEDMHRKVESHSARILQDLLYR